MFIVTPEMHRQWETDGYLLVSGLFNPHEMDLLGKVGKADQELASQIKERHDASGAITTLALSNDLGEDIYSAIVRCPRVANTMETLLGDEVYHYHHKMNMKAPYVGGAWEWHQDYGYWYGNGCLTPDMGSCFIAVDRATRENGCLQVVRGSHKMGRIDHGKVADQTGADMERVDEAMKVMELVYVEMEPGDALFFHSNLLHRSDRNNSPNPRWVFICCYNTKSNNPYKESYHPRYSPLEIWSDSRVAEIGEAQLDQILSAKSG
ncbi:MAG: phytanoyl-CoA dioxygenase family protein [Chthonomonadales bacterium]